MKEWTEIYEQMRGTFAQRAGFVPSEGCDSAVRLYALAAELQSLLMQADWVLDQSFPQTAQGTYLDYHAETRGITRGAADKTWRELTTVRIVDDVIPALRASLRARFVRSKNTAQVRAAIRSQVMVELENKRAQEIIDSFGEVSVKASEDDPTVCLVEFSFAVAHGLNRIYLSAHITV